MDAFTISAASGMRARLDSLEMLANNLANQSSPGFKPDRETYGLYAAAESRWPQDESSVQSPTVPVVERQWTDFRQGPIRQSGEAYDFALDGPGFFAVRSKLGDLLTRNGNFRLSPAGDLETQDGYAVLDERGQPIRLAPRQAIEVSPLGEIRQEGVVVSRLGIATVGDPNSLSKQGGTYFGITETLQFGRPANSSVYQGRLEGSTLAPAEGAVRLIHVLRQFESLTKAIQIHAEMNRRSDDVARVNA
jgi:flagellar basal-body rod protein FlgF